MLRADAILGRRDEPRYAGRRADPVLVGWGDASKRRLRVRSAAGVDVGIDFPRGTYLAHGAVLADDGERIVTVERRLEEALVVRFAGTLDRAGLVLASARLAHCLGNQHVPLEVVDGELRAPVTTSRELMAATVAGLRLPGATVSFEDVRLGREHPLAAAHVH